MIKDQIKSGQDIVVVARKSDPAASFDSIGKELRYLFHKLDLLDKEEP